MIKNFTEGLKSYPQHATAKLHMQKMQEIEQDANAQGLPTDRNTLGRMVSMHPGLNNQMNSQNQQLIGRGTLSGSAQAALALSNYQNLLMRQNSMNSTSSNPLQQETSSFNNSNQSPSSSFHGTSALTSAPMQNLPGSGHPSPHLPQQQSQQSQVQQQLHQRPNVNNQLVQNHPQSTQGNGNNNQAMQNQMIQQLLQMSNNNGGNSGGGQQQQLPVSNTNGSMAGAYTGFGGSSSVPAAGTSNVSANNVPAPSRSNSFKSVSTGDVVSAAGGRRSGSGFNQRSAELQQNLQLDDDIMQDIAHDFTENGFFNSDLDDNMCFSWKGQLT